MSCHFVSMSEINLLFCALTGCTSPKTVHPDNSPCTFPIYSNNKWLTKRAHTGCTSPKIVHPAMEMCAPGAGCTLNFGHWSVIFSYVDMLYVTCQFKKNLYCHVEFKGQGPPALWTPALWHSLDQRLSVRLASAFQLPFVSAAVHMSMHYS